MYFHKPVSLISKSNISESKFYGCWQAVGDKTTAGWQAVGDKTTAGWQAVGDKTVQ